MLAARGVHSLRFDYFGTGDSAGETTEADLKGWCGDIETAIDELTHMTGCRRVILIGMRLGGTLAAEVAAKRPDDGAACIAMLGSAGIYRATEETRIRGSSHA